MKTRRKHHSTRKKKKTRFSTRRNRKPRGRTYRAIGGGVNAPMNCSPAVDKISVNNSCYTPNVLIRIRDEYNKDHPDTKITESDPTKLWKALNKRLTQCLKEDCWLNQIDDVKLRRKIDRYLFAPDKPYEWKKNPLEWLSNYDILNVLEQYEETYSEFDLLGPTPIDFDKVINGKCVWNEICRFNLLDQINQKKTKFGIVFNLSPHTSSGSHWVSLFIDTKARLIFYFDSAGDSIPKEIEVFKDRVQDQLKNAGMEPYRFLQNHPKEHQQGNTECGVYSLYFIITMLTGKINKKRASLKRRIKLFMNDTIPDEYMEKRRNMFFND